MMPQRWSFETSTCMMRMWEATPLIPLIFFWKGNRGGLVRQRKKTSIPHNGRTSRDLSSHHLLFQLLNWVQKKSIVSQIFIYWPNSVTAIFALVSQSPIIHLATRGCMSTWNISAFLPWWDFSSCHPIIFNYFDIKSKANQKKISS